MKVEIITSETVEAAVTEVEVTKIAEAEAAIVEAVLGKATAAEPLKVDKSGQRSSKGKSSSL